MSLEAQIARNVMVTILVKHLIIAGIGYAARRALKEK